MTMTMTAIAEPAPVPGEPRTLLALLPGADMKAADFRTHGLMAAARLALPGIDLLAVETGIDGYLDDRVAERLEAEILAPALAAAPAQLWLAGISLGALGALSHAASFPGRAERLLLVAPFVGSRGLIAEIERAGGLEHWRPSADVASGIERRALGWLGGIGSDTAGRPDIRLGFGDEDRFAASHRLIARLLPPDRTVTVAGRHDWPTWTRLWSLLLDRLAS